LTEKEKKCPTCSDLMVDGKCRNKSCEAVRAAQAAAAERLIQAQQRNPKENEKQKKRFGR